MEEAERKEQRKADIVRCKSCTKPIIMLSVPVPGVLYYCPDCIPPNS